MRGPCLTCGGPPTCGGARGCCGPCYARHANAVLAGRETWEALVGRGLAAPSRMRHLEALKRRIRDGELGRVR